MSIETNNMNDPGKAIKSVAARRSGEYNETAGYSRELPEQLFDGFAVYQELDDKAKMRTSPENVSDVLDAVVRLIKKSE